MAGWPRHRATRTTQLHHRLPGLSPCACSLILCALLLRVAHALAGTGAQQPRYDFHIPPGQLRDALQAFALTSDHRLFYRASIVAGLSSSPLEGRYTLDEALAMLLQGTALRYAVTGSGVVVITSRQDPASTSWATRLAGILARLSGRQGPSGQARGAAARATDSTISADQLAEVTVTATRRSEVQLDVPMSMVVISANQLRQQQVTRFDDFAVAVPNLNFDYSEGGSVDDRGVAIRGIEGTDTTGFYLDDLPMPISLDPRVVDLQRIEVLEGPQGTLYGARSMGGTIREITTAPDLTRYSASVQLQGTTLDGGSNGFLADVTANVPLVSGALALRITPYRGQDGGWITRAWPVPGYTPGPAPAGNPGTTVYDCECTPGRVADTAQTSYDGLNAQLLWRPLAALAIRPKFLYQKEDTNGLPLGNYSAGNTTDYMHFDIPEGIVDQFMFYGGTVDYALPIGTLTSATSRFDRQTRDYEDDSEFTAFGYGTPLLPSPVAVFTDAHDITEELRFVSAWRLPLQLTAGLYYDRNDSSAAFNQFIAQFPAFYGTPVVASLWNPSHTTQAAVYGELTWQLAAHWWLTLGERDSQDTYHAGGKLWGAIAFPAGLTYATSDFSLASHESDHVLTPRYVVKYEPSEDLDLYADASKGFRPGAGQIAPGSNLCAADYAATHLTPQELSQYGPDWVWNYELGEKAFFANHRYSLDSSVFWIQWSNMRESLLFTCGEGAQINAGQAVSKGVELQVSAVPLNGVSLSGGLGYDDARLVRPGPLISVPPAGAPIQEVAPLTANFSAQYEHAWGPLMHWSVHFDYSYTAHRYSVANSPLYPRLVPAYALENVRLSLVRGPGEYALFVKNLGGVHPNLSDEVSTAAEDPGRPRWTEGPPTAYGIEARFSF